MQTLFSKFRFALIPVLLLPACGGSNPPADVPEPPAVVSTEPAPAATPEPAAAATPEPTPAPKEVETPDLVETAVKDGQFTNLVKAIGEAGLTETLKGAGPFTVFAPNDEAFGKLKPAQLEKLLKDKSKLEKVLKYHVVAGKSASADVSEAKSLKSLEGKDLKIVKNKKDGSVTVGGAKLIKTDIATKNGVIHVIDKVLMP